MQTAIPIRTYHQEDLYAWSWGRYVTEWFYAESFDEGIAQVQRWVEQQCAEFKAASMPDATAK